MADLNRMLQLAQSTGGSPYDEDQFMPVPGSSQANHWLNKRLDNRLMQQGTGDGYNSGFWGNMHRQMSERIPHMMTPEGYEDRFSQPQPAPAGSDTDMMQMYGPEDQVAYDGQGNPIPLADPRHPMSQRRQQMPQNMLMYPQRR